MCIGTDRSTGDALGPIIGTYLHKYRSPLFELYGTLDEPVHAMNLESTLIEINDRVSKPFIIGIDACLGQLSSVGCVQLGPGPVRPGAGVNKELPPVGDIHMTGIVNVGGFMEYFVSAEYPLEPGHANGRINVFLAIPVAARFSRLFYSRCNARLIARSSSGVRRYAELPFCSGLAYI